MSEVPLYPYPMTLVSGWVGIVELGLVWIQAELNYMSVIKASRFALSHAGCFLHAGKMNLPLLPHERMLEGSM